MDCTRRTILRAGVGSTLWYALRGVATASQAGLQASGRVDPSGRVFVLLQLTGGNDGLNTLIPYRHPVYRAARPKLAIPPDRVLRLDDEFGLHPSLQPLMALLDQGRLGIVQGVGLPDVNRSHFHSLRIWHTARLDSDERTPGWLARVLEASDSFQRRRVAALYVSDTSLPQTFTGGTHQVPSLDRLEDFRLLPDVPPGERPSQAARLLQASQSAGTADGASPALARDRLASAYDVGRRFEALVTAPNAVPYPEDRPLGARLRLVSQCIRSGLDAMVYSTELDGFDTHFNQNTTHPFLLGHLAAALGAFYQELSASGDADRVLTLVYSEFGRRIEENGSAGTDHGTAGPVLLCGPVKPGVSGAMPDLDHLEDGDPRTTIDFRRVYATVLQRWLSQESSIVLGERFEPLPLFS